MNQSRISTYLIGIILIIVGFGILFNNLNIFRFDFGSFIVPIILLFIGIKLFDRGKQTAAVILLAIGALTLLGALGINIGSVFGLAFSLAIIYFGYRMMRSKRKEFKIPSPTDRAGSSDHFTSPDQNDASFTKSKEEVRNEGARYEKEGPYTKEKPDREGTSYEEHTRYDKQREESFSSRHSQHDKEHATFNQNKPKVKHSLIGNLYMTAPRWELTDMNIWHGIGEVKIDLSRALIHDTESVLIINGWIGDIDIYVPYDLEVAVSANINVGDIDVFGNKEGGVNRNVSVETSGYRHAAKRVRVIVSLLIGDVDVIYV